MSKRPSKQNPLKNFFERIVQRSGREESERAGTRGRKEHKGGASSAHKHIGGKRAR